MKQRRRLGDDIELRGLEIWAKDGRWLGDVLGMGRRIV
jgi:hypothetical protein